MGKYDVPQSPILTKASPNQKVYVVVQQKVRQGITLGLCIIGDK